MSINGHKQKKREWLRYRDFVLSPYGVIKIKSLGYNAATRCLWGPSPLAGRQRRVPDSALTFAASCRSPCGLVPLTVIFYAL
ncbi:hypothetical protein [Symbiopectobacterium sp. RP]|uniref:hypothetical protein n=1 Tax=Symbiopectobacterium sp. RP TaxID=3248553 RepID=UPI003D2CD6FA